MRKIDREPLGLLDKKIVTFPGGQSQIRYLLPCEECKNSHWVSRSLWLIGQSRYCIECGHKVAGRGRKGKTNRWMHGKKSPLYRRGFSLSRGYRILNVTLDSPFRAMADRYGRVPEHRLKVAKKLKRLLETWEVVHHKNGIKDDNRISNLEVLSKASHCCATRMENEIKRLRNENSKLRTQLIKATARNKAL